MNNQNSVTGQSLNDQIVCAYACPAQDYTNLPFNVPKTIIDWTNSETPEKKDINYYKNEFISLFKEMEEKHGKCISVNIKHLNEEISIEINY